MKKIDIYKETNPVLKSINLFLILFLLFGSLLGGTVAVFYKIQFNSILNEIRNEETHGITIQRNELESKMNDIISDLLFLSRQNELKQYLNTGNRKNLSSMEEEYQELAVCKGRYDQIRYLDEFGKEVVRINYNRETAYVVDRKKLQNKSKRYYFRDTFKLKQGQIFVSPLDLNIENKKIEQPLKPMIRLGTPVFDEKGEKRGIILINYLAQNILDAILESSTPFMGSSMLLNSNGYWLLNEDPKLQWGFMIPERKNYNFSLSYPEEWQTILQKEQGQIYTKKGLFTFTTIQPLQKNEKSSFRMTETESIGSELVDSSLYSWILITHVSPQILKKYVSPLQVRIFLLGMGLFFFISLIAWFLALAITKRKIYQSHLIAMAHYDPLTCLPNRKFFFERLEAGIAHAQRNKNPLGLLYIDLDGFKDVNDTFGHEAGDELLIKIGERMTSIVRKTDTVARLGGDEFATILFEVNSREGIMTAGKKLIQEINKPIELSYGNVTVGASIGASVYPENTQDLEELVKLADQAMYVSKSKGKNMCTMSTNNSCQSE